MLIRNPAKKFLRACVGSCVGMILIFPIRPLPAQTLETQGAANGQADLLLDAAQRDPTVAAVLELPRKTPIDTLVAFFTLLDLGEDHVAETLLAPLLQRQLTPDERARLVAHFGSAKFLRLARLERSGNELEVDTRPFTGARQFAEACLKAAADRAHDPKRIASLVSQLHDPKAEVRHAAQVDLQATGSAGVVACLHALATVDADSTGVDSNGDRQKQRAYLLTTLVGLHPATDEPLLAMLAKSESLLARDLAELAGHLHMSAAIPWLAKLVACAPDDLARPAARKALAKMGISAPTPEAVRALALREVNRLQKTDPTKDLDLVPWWTWSPVKGSPAKKLLAANEVPPDQLQALRLARLSNLLISCPDPTPTERQLALIYTLEAIRWAIDSKDPAAAEIDPNLITRGKQLADSLSIDQLSATLTEAIRRDRLRAAIAVVRLLGRLGDRAALASLQGRPSPLAHALRHPNMELRFAALQALMKFAPEHSFAGSSYLPEALWAFSTGSGPPEALVVSPLIKRRSIWAGQLRELGYQALPVATGREALQAAGRSSRLALILIDANVSRPAAREVHYQLRSSTQAGHVPMAIVCGGAQLLQYDRLTASDSLLVVAMRPTVQPRLAEIILRLQQMADPPLAAGAVRLQRAGQALVWLTQLLQLPSAIAGNAYHELRRSGQIAEQTLYQPELAAASLRLLEHLGTADSQLTLLDYASDKTLPMENRQAAMASFATSVDQSGILLTTEQIHAQYDRYNASQSDELQNQQILGKLLDVLEARAADR
jgi:CheY-like chemotaxis protein